MNNKLEDSKWKMLFSGEHNCKFDNLGFSMMVGRLSRRFKKNPNELTACIEEANSFCNKYGAILGNDLAKVHNA